MFLATALSPSPTSPWQAAQTISKRLRPRSSMARVTGRGLWGSALPSGPIPLATSGGWRSSRATVPGGAGRMDTPSSQKSLGR
jgi:hypothetical protein